MGHVHHDSRRRGSSKRWNEDAASLLGERVRVAQEALLLLKAMMLGSESMSEM
jgi:hypothetical protein